MIEGARITGRRADTSRARASRRRRPSSPLKIPTALAAVIVLAAACTSGSGPTPSPSPPPRPGPAWLAVLGQIRDDGTVSKETALQAFSVAFAPLPGVQVPTGGAGTIPSGTAAVRWLIGHWDQITPQQRLAAEELVPDLREIDAGPSGSSALGAPADDAGSDPAMQPVAFLMTAQKHSNSFYTQLAQQLAGEIGSRLHPTRQLGLTIDVHVGPLTDVAAWMETIAAGGKCLITVGPQGDAQSGANLELSIAHEVWHCFEDEVLGSRQGSAPSWIVEGEAEWVGDSLYPGAPRAAIQWPLYLTIPQGPLFTRSYSAIGFYSQLDSSGTDVWSKLIPILEATDNAGAFSAAGAEGDAFLSIWATGFFRMPERGSAWDITGPGVTSDRADVPYVQVPDGQTVKAEAAPYADAIFGIDGASAADVLAFSFSGHARVSDDAGHDYLIQGDTTLCHKDGGCECPDGGSGQTPLSPLEGGGVIALAVTGDPGGNAGSVTGISLDELCKGSLTGTWEGGYTMYGMSEWGFTMVLVQTGNKVTGTGEVTGPTCVRHQTITGTVSGSHVHLVEEGERDVILDGRVKGKSMSGTWTAISCGKPFSSPNTPIEGTWEAKRVG